MIYLFVIRTYCLAVVNVKPSKEMAHGRTANDLEAKSGASVAPRGTDARALSGVPDRGILPRRAAAHLPRAGLALPCARGGASRIGSFSHDHKRRPPGDRAARFGRRHLLLRRPWTAPPPPALP